MNRKHYESIFQDTTCGAESDNRQLCNLLGNVVDTCRKPSLFGVSPTLLDWFAILPQLPIRNIYVLAWRFCSPLLEYVCTVDVWPYVGVRARLEEIFDLLYDLRYRCSSFQIAVAALTGDIYFRVVGASGAVFGLLLAFGVMHPNNMIYIIPLPFPIKAKWFVVGYAVLEIALGWSGANTGVAHFAHVGGMLWGLLLLYWWKKRGKIFF